MHRLVFYSFSQSMEFVKCITCFVYFFTNSLFLTGQLSSFAICAVSFSFAQDHVLP